MNPTETNIDPKAGPPRSLRVARYYFLGSVLVFFAGVFIAAKLYPGGYDWVYTVVSSLAAQKYNPEGGAWFSVGFSLSMVILWPSISILRDLLAPADLTTKIAFVAFRVGLISGFLMGLERLLIYDWSDSLAKAHEILGILTFGGLYVGVIILQIGLLYRNRNLFWLTCLILLPIFAIAYSQIYLYFDQRDLGWVTVRWREMGIPIWLSFAFWQWMAVIFLYVGLGSLLVFLCDDRRVKACIAPPG